MASMLFKRWHDITIEAGVVVHYTFRDQFEIASSRLGVVVRGTAETITDYDDISNLLLVLTKAHLQFTHLSQNNAGPHVRVDPLTEVELESRLFADAPVTIPDSQDN